MFLAPKGAFDRRAEREYYKSPPTVLRDFRFLEPQYRNFLRDCRAVFDGKVVVDVGAGECLHGMFAAATCEPRLYLNVDLFADRMLLASRSRPSPVMRFAVGDIFRLPVRTGAADVVWTSLLMFRLGPLDPVVAEINRVLRPDGCFIGVEANFWNPLVALRILGRRPGHPHWNVNDGYLSPRHVRTAFEKRGFDVELRFFWRKLRWLRHPILSPTLGVIARRRAGREA